MTSPLLGQGQTVTQTDRPTREIGHNGAVTPPWGYFGAGVASTTMDAAEVPALQWPSNLLIYERMRTDSQIDALIRAVTYPLRGLRWCIDPNGARDEVVAQISQDMALPIVGTDSQDSTKGRRKKRFNHDDHLRLSLLGPTVYGHMAFEMVGHVADDLAWRMDDLAPRMPRSIQRFVTDRNGSLQGVQQYDSSTFNPEPIPISQLVMYVWEREGANWTGRSLLRPLYKHWLLKDRLLRIDTIKNERFGAGIPTSTAAPGGDPADHQKLASSIRASENGGVGLPNGASIGVEGIRGALPDTLGSIRYHDEAMARTFLAMFMQLGQTQTGSRALGEEFVDFFEDALVAFARWYADTTTAYLIEDIVDWNWSPDEPAPALTWEQTEKAPLSADELANLIYRGALVVDEDLEGWVRKRYNMPEYSGGPPLPTKPGDIAQETVPVAAGGKPSKGTPADQRLKENKGGKVTKDHLSVKALMDAAPGMSEADAIAFVEAHLGHLHDDKSHGNRPNAATDDDGPATVPAGREAKPAHVGFLASSQTLGRPKVGHRAPTAIEAAAGTDFDALQAEWQSATDGLVRAWGSVRSAQIDELLDAIEQAVDAGDATALATISATPQGADLLLSHLTGMAKSGITSAVAEAASQGRTLSAPDVADLGTSLTARANATAALMARSISDSAARQALNRFGVDAFTGSDVRDAVKGYLDNLSDAYLNDQLGGAMTGAQNEGRLMVMRDAAKNIYASELMDANTCDPCGEVDGTEYADADAANQDYPTMAYKDCLGGPRCRGTLVAVYEEETG